MSDPDSQSIFEYSLSGDKSTLTIQLRDGVREYTADEVTKLALFFANLRAGMSPPVPDDSRLDLVPAVECPRYEVIQNPEDGTAQVYLQTPGLFWSYIHLSQDKAKEVAEYIDPSRAIQGGIIAH
jgi:hypothetical protein